MEIDFDKYVQALIDWAVTSGWKILVILALMWVGAKLSRRAAERLFSKRKKESDGEYKKRAETLATVVTYLFNVIIFVVGAVTILSQFRIKVGPILAAAGVVGVAVGFGAQHLVRDVISGFFILLDDQIRAGDVVVIAGKGGLVEKVSLRMTILRDLAGNVHYVRNGEITVVTNMTKEYSRYVFDIGVAYREDVDEVIKVIKEVDEDLRGDPELGPEILEPIEILGLDQFADSAVIIKARTKTKPIKQWSVAREFNRRLKKRFDEKDIEIPFPHVTLYMGQGKEGEAAPMNVNMQGAR
jgi:small conductance mechanosensitive channel